MFVLGNRVIPETDPEAGISLSALQTVSTLQLLTFFWACDRSVAVSVHAQLKNE